MTRPRTFTRTAEPRFAPVIAVAALMLVAVGCETSNPELRNAGRMAQRRGDYVTARNKYAQAVNQRATDMMAHYRLGEVYLAMDQPREAQLTLEEALTLAEDTNNAPVTQNTLDLLAEALYQQEREDRLYGFLQQAVDTYGTANDYLRQAEYLSKMGDVDGAKTAYRKAVHFAGADNPEPYIAMARFYDRINDVPNAVRALRWAYYVDPGNEEVASRLRNHGIVPGPTVAEKPDKPALLE